MRIEVRIGMNTGEVVMRIGADRRPHRVLTDRPHRSIWRHGCRALAPAGPIAVSEETRRLVEGYFELRALGPTEVKGISEPIEVYEVIGLGALHGHFDLAARRGLTTLRRSRARA